MSRSSSILFIAASTTLLGCPSTASSPEPWPASCPDLSGSDPTATVQIDSQYGTYSIDVTEVTFLQYAAFLGAAQTSNQPEYCAWNTSFAPDPACIQDIPVAQACSRHPQVCVDWCDAAAYCTWAGKHLCGAIGPSLEPVPAVWGISEPNTSAWVNACSNDGTTNYAWGEYDKSKELQCATAFQVEVGRSGTVDVGSLPECHGVGAGFDQIFDLGGNVSEFENSCAAWQGQDDDCTVAGCGIGSGGGACNCRTAGPVKRNFTSSGIGFRCCSD